MSRAFSPRALVIVFGLALLSKLGYFKAESGVAKPDKPFEITTAEKDLIERTNAERKKDDKPPLKSSDVLMAVARAHAANMAKQKTMAHELDGKSPADRVKDAGYEFWQMSENIAQGPKANKDVIKGWMDSKGHHDNILSDLPTEIGVARAKAADGTVYWVQIFGRPKSEPPPKLPLAEKQHEGQKEHEE